MLNLIQMQVNLLNAVEKSSLMWESRLRALPQKIFVRVTDIPNTLVSIKKYLQIDFKYFHTRINKPWSKSHLF